MGPDNTNAQGSRPEPMRGECLCGAVAFDAYPYPSDDPERRAGVCRCAGCRHWTGASAMPFVVAIAEQFRPTRGHDLIALYRDTDATLRAFCRRCGSSIYQDMGSTYRIAAGVLRDPVDSSGRTQ